MSPVAAGTAERTARRATIPHVRTDAPDAGWLHALGPLVGTESVCGILSIGPLDVAAGLAGGSLIAIRTAPAGSAWFPEWQLDESRGTVRPGVHDIIRVFRDELGAMDGIRDIDMLIGTWSYTTQDGVLEGKSPAEWVRDGGCIATLERAARDAAAHMAAAG